MLRSSCYPILYTVPAFETLHAEGEERSRRIVPCPPGDRAGSGSGIRGPRPGPGAALMRLDPGGRPRKKPSLGELSGAENSLWLFDRFFSRTPQRHIQLYHGRRAKARAKGDILKIASPEAGEAAFYRKTCPDARFFKFRLFGAFGFVLPPEKRYIEPVRPGPFGSLSGAENGR